MTRNQRGASTLLPAAALALALVVLVGSSAYFIFAETWWLPDPINQHAEIYDVQFGRTMLLVGVIFLLAQFTLGFVLLRYRDQGQKAEYSHGNDKLEVVWTTATAILFIALGIAGESSWANLHFKGAAPGAMQVDVFAKQFAWNFRYPGPDGEFGRTDPALIDDALGNPMGLDYDDPAALDDIVTPVLAVPLNQEVELGLRTQDVTHSFFVRELRLKQDTTPGLRIRVHFVVEKAGDYAIICAELCGNQHNNMKSTLQALSREEFEKFLADNAPLTGDEEL